MQEHTERLGSAPLGKLLLSLSLPSIASMVTLALYNIIDTFWVARLGHEAIAALTIVLPYHILMIAVGVGSGIGINSLASRRFGEQDIKAANDISGQMFLITVVFSSIFLVAAALFPRAVATALGATPDIMDYTIQYLVVISFGAPFLIFTLIAQNLLRGSGDAIRPMIFMIAASIMNIILDPLLIFGIGPFPEMGVGGAALATVISQLLSAALSLYYIFAGKSSYQLEASNLKPNLLILRDVYRIGFPSMIIEITQSICFILFNNVLSSFGSLAIASAGIAIRISDLAFMPIIGVSNGLLPIVGFNFGARIWKRLWGAIKLASNGLMLGMAIATVLLEIFAPDLIRIFSRDPEMLAIAVPAMRIVITSLPLVGPTILYITAFQGLSKGKAVLVLSLARQFLFFIPVIYLLPPLLGLNGAWLAIPVSDALGFFVTALWLLRERKRQRTTGVWTDLTI